MTDLTLAELARRINDHLKRVERTGAMSDWHQAGAYYMGGARIRITYVSRQGGTTLSRPKAQAYLDWLDAGHVGRHDQHVIPNAHASTQRLDGPDPAARVTYKRDREVARHQQKKKKNDDEEKTLARVDSQCLSPRLDLPRRPLGDK